MQTRSEEELKRLIAGVKREITGLGDMRPGHLSVQYRRSGGREIGYRSTSGRFTRSARRHGDTENVFRGRLGFASPSSTASQSNLRAFVPPSSSVLTGRGLAERIRKEEEDA